jgi:hypothetical protein
MSEHWGTVARPVPPPLPGDPRWPQAIQAFDDRPLPAYWPDWARRHPWRFSALFALQFGAEFAGFFRFMNGWGAAGSLWAGAAVAVMMFVTTLRRIDKPPWQPKWGRSMGMDIRRQPVWFILLSLPVWIGIGITHIVLGFRDHRPVQVLWAIAFAIGLSLMTLWGWKYKRRVLELDRSPDASGTTS